jgi:alpha-beta hydrolase superfamily lysophospholipase
VVSDTTTSPSVLSFAEPEGLKARGTLIVIPGRGEQPAVYTRFGQRLANDAYRVLVVGDPTSAHTPARTPFAHTPSEHTPSEHTPAEHEPELLTVQLEELTLQLEQLAAEAPAPVVLVGSDTGALFAAAIAAEDRLPAVAGLILAGLPSVETAASPDTDSAAPADRWESELDARTTCPTHRGRISDRRRSSSRSWDCTDRTTRSARWSVPASCSPRHRRRSS